MTGSIEIEVESMSEVMEDFLRELVHTTRLANDAYDQFSTEDAVAVLEYRVTLFEEYGLGKLHPRNIDEDTVELESGMRITDDGVEMTSRGSYNFDVGFVSGRFYSREITDDELATVVRGFAEYVEEYGVESLGGVENR